MIFKKTSFPVFFALFATTSLWALPMLRVEEEKTETRSEERAAQESLRNNTERLSREASESLRRDTRELLISETLEEELSKNIRVSQDTFTAWDAELTTLDSLTNPDFIALEETATSVIAHLGLQEEALGLIPIKDKSDLLESAKVFLKQAQEKVIEVRNAATKRRALLSDAAGRRENINLTAAVEQAQDRRLPVEEQHAVEVREETTPVALPATTMEQEQPNPLLPARARAADKRRWAWGLREKLALGASLFLAIKHRDFLWNRASQLPTALSPSNLQAVGKKSLDSLVASSRQSLCSQLESSYSLFPETSIALAGLLQCKSHLDDVTATSPAYLPLEEIKARWATGVLLKNPLAAEALAQEGHEKALHTSPENALATWDNALKLRAQAEQAWSQTLPTLLKNNQPSSLQLSLRSLGEAQQIHLHSLAQGILEKRNRKEAVAHELFKKALSSLNALPLNVVYPQLQDKVSEALTSLHQAASFWEGAKEEMAALDWTHDPDGQTAFLEQATLGKERCQAEALIWPAEQELTLELNDYFSEPKTPHPESTEEGAVSLSPIAPISLRTPRAKTTEAWIQAIATISLQKNQATTEATKTLWSRYLERATRESIHAKAMAITPRLYQEEEIFYAQSHSITSPHLSPVLANLHTRLELSWKEALLALKKQQLLAPEQEKLFWEEEIHYGERHADQLAFMPLEWHLETAKNNEYRELVYGQTNDQVAAREAFTKVRVELLDAYRNRIKYLTKFQQNHPERFTAPWKNLLQQAQQEETYILTNKRSLMLEERTGGKVSRTPRRDHNSIQEYLEKRKSGSLKGQTNPGSFNGTRSYAM